MIQLAAHPICRVEHVTSLGLIIDDQLSWSNHIKELCRKISSAIGALRRIRSLISQSTEEQIYKASIQPYFDYCAPVWDGLSSYLCKTLQKLKKRGAITMDKSLGTNLHLWRFSTRAKQILLHLFSPPPSPPPLLQCWKRVHAISPEFQHCIGVCVCVYPPDRTYKDHNVFTHQRCEDHRSYEDRYPVLVNLRASNGLNRRETYLQRLLASVLVNHPRCV